MICNRTVSDCCEDRGGGKGRSSEEATVVVPAVVAVDVEKRGQILDNFEGETDKIC